MGKILEAIKGARKIELYLAAACAALLLLMCVDDGGDGNSGKTQQEIRIEAILEKVDGAGSVDVMIAEGGGSVLVVAEGADDPAVRLQLTDAVSSLTGLGADKITVTKMRVS